MQDTAQPDMLDQSLNRRLDGSPRVIDDLTITPVAMRQGGRRGSEESVNWGAAGVRLEPHELLVQADGDDNPTVIPLTGDAHHTARNLLFAAVAAPFVCLIVSTVAWRLWGPKQ
ncbi:MAG: hypothetical protein KDD78_05920 [Caldilineaceae bacterium]|nr:hypothetical protein [Caldilineaceae bacterium]